MTNREFSDSFDTLLNSYSILSNFGEGASKQTISLDEYEKSVILTQAQDIIVKSYFDAHLNPLGLGFDDSTRRLVDFSSLIKVAEISPSEDSSSKKFDERGIIFKLPLKTNNGNNVADTCDVLFILNEKVLVKKVTRVNQNVPITYDVTNLVVVPISYKEYDREMSKPFALPLKKQAWRLFQNNATGYDIDSELILKLMYADKYSANPSTVGDIAIIYRIRYVRRPKPIVLEDLPDGLEIDGEMHESQCELNPVLHMDILNKAVEIAVNTRGGARPSENRERLSERR